MKKQRLQTPKEIELKSSQYQPSKAEKEVGVDMPGMSEEELRKVFFRPFKVREED